MNELLQQSIKKKILGYITGELSVPDLYEWAKGIDEFSKALPYIKDRSDIIFFLMNQAGFEIRNFYIEERLEINKNALIKNIKRCVNKEIEPEDLYNWADDILNWELVEGFENQTVKAAVGHISENSERLKSLTSGDWENILWHLEKPGVSVSSVNCLNFIFSLPDLRDILSSSGSYNEKIQKIAVLADLFEEKLYFDRLLNSIRVMLGKGFEKEDFEKSFDAISRDSLPDNLI